MPNSYLFKRISEHAISSMHYAQFFPMYLRLPHIAQNQAIVIKEGKNEFLARSVNRSKFSIYRRTYPAFTKKSSIEELYKDIENLLKKLNEWLPKKDSRYELNILNCLTINYLLVGEINIAKSYSNQAIELLKLLPEKDAFVATIDSYRILAVIAQTEGKVLEAIDYLKTLPELEKKMGYDKSYPEFQQKLFELGMAYMTAEHYSDALSCFQQLLPSSARNFNVYPCLGIACTLQGDIAQAIYYHKKSIEYNKALVGINTIPFDTIDINNLGVAYNKAGDYNKARLHIESAYQLIKQEQYATEHPLYSQTLNNLKMIQTIEDCQFELPVDEPSLNPS
jgi:tetratricopeptide (TPR) repeat protein